MFAQAAKRPPANYNCRWCAANKNNPCDNIQQPLAAVCCLMDLLDDSFLCQLLFLVLGDFAQVFGPVKAVQEENAVKVVNLMLEDTRKPAIGIHFDWLATHIQALNDNFLGTADIL